MRRVATTILFLLFTLLNFVAVVAHAQGPPEEGCPPDDGTCWNLDQENQVMSWYGAEDGRVDIHQGTGQILGAIRDGWVAIFETTVPGRIIITTGTINGNPVSGPVQVEAGTYEVISAGPSGGFRWTPLDGYGWRAPVQETAESATTPTSTPASTPIPGGKTISFIIPLWAIFIALVVGGGLLHLRRWWRRRRAEEAPPEPEESPEVEPEPEEKTS